MIALGIAAASVVVFLVSSVYYALITPVEQRVLGDRALDRGRPQAWKIAAELARNVILASAFAWVASRAHMVALPGSLAVALVLWIGFPLILLSGSVMWERVHPITAAIHAGDWLLKLLLISVLIGLWH